MFGPNRGASWWAPAWSDKLDKASPSRCPRTATPPWSVGLMTTHAPGRRGSSLVVAVPGPNKVANWSAPARLETPRKASLSRCQPTATPPLWAGSQDNLKAGAAWVFTRSGDVWTQRGSKLVGTGAVGNAYQGVSVALSADGNTAIVGGSGDNSDAGAAWVYTRSGDIWIQQGSKLIGTGAVGKAGQGYSVALSADGNTAIVGGLGDNANTGAAWVYGRSGAAWSQQGSKLVGSRAVGEAKQGYSVAMSADGNTAVVGGLGDNSYSGAAWAYSRSGATWSQQGDKLVGVGAIGHAEQGFSAALSADGNTAIVGGIADKVVTGAAWVHNRRDGIWTQGPFLGY